MPGYANAINNVLDTGLGYAKGAAMLPYSVPMAAYQQAKTMFGLGSQPQQMAQPQPQQNSPWGIPQQQQQPVNYSGQNRFNQINQATGYPM